MILSSMHHTFDVELAKEYGIEEAILIHHFQHWISHNQKLGRNFIDGRTWTYQTIEEITAHFSYLTPKKVRYAIDTLISKEIIIKGNFNKSSMDKTLWYAFKNQEMFTKDKIGKSSAKIGNSIAENGKAIPHTIPHTKDVLSKDKTIAPDGAKPRPKLGDLISFDKDKKKFVGITEEDLARWKEAYPRVNIQLELARATDWLIATPSKAKKKNWNGFLRGWFSRNEDRAENREAYQTLGKLSPTKQPDSQKKIEDEWAYVNAFISKNPLSYKYLKFSKECVQIQIGNAWTSISYTENGFKDQFMSAIRKGNHI